MSAHAAIRLPAPAKLNLFLHINGRRPDGYHELQTLFQLTDRCDELVFTPRADHLIQLQQPLAGVADADNLILRAANLLRDQAQALGRLDLSATATGIDIQLTKQLPMGGGLGGGSSDAATTLLALNHLWGIGLSLAQLANLGKRLGADVPVFILGRSAWAEGIGEQLTPIELPTRWYLVMQAEVNVSTGVIFSHAGLTRHSPKIKIAPAFDAGDEAYRNDCQDLVCKLYKPIGESVEWLNQFTQARLTGTGACIFGSFPTESEALAVLAKIPAHIQGTRIQGFVAKGINQSPVHEKLMALK